MSLLANLQLMSRYNQLMNQKIYRVAEQLSDEEIKCDRGTFFGSILGSFNHIYVADIIWLRRFANHPQQYPSLNRLPELANYTKLNQTVADDLKTMIEIRQKLDTTIINWCREIEPEDLKTNLQYHNTKGNYYCKKFSELIHHFFNHQTHHRGQISTLLNQQGLDLGITDLLEIIPER